MTKPTLYRKRYIPNEIVSLENDIIVKMNEQIIVTKWKTIKPRADFASGSSCFFLNRGFKISKFYDENDKFLYNYCDIIETIYNEEKNEYIFNDLLIDIVVYPNGEVKVLDLAEIADALDEKIITIEKAMQALRTTDELLNIIYNGKFAELASFLD